MRFCGFLVLVSFVILIVFFIVRIGDCVLVLKLVCGLLGGFGNLGEHLVWFV